MEKRNHLFNSTHSLFGLTDQYGGLTLRIVIAIITLALIGGAIGITLTTNRENQQQYHRKVLSISEYGLLMALQKLHSEPSWRSPIEKTEYDGGWYKVDIENEKVNDTLYLTIISEGHFKSASDSKRCVLNLSVSNGDSIWVRRSMQ